MSKKRIEYEIGFKVDDNDVQKATGSLDKITKTLKSINSMDIGSFMNATGISDMKKAEEQLKLIKDSAVAVGNSLQASFNQKLNTYNVQQFNQELKKTGFNLRDLGPLWTQLGSQGELAFTQVANAITQTQNLARKTTGIFDKLGETMANTVRWKVTSSLIDGMSGSIQQAWGYTKALDTSLNNIRIVTGKSAVEMEKFARSANKAAKGLSTSTTAYTDAALIYYQQGLSDKEANTRAAITVKAANVTGQSAAEVSEQLTAVWNGYKVVAEEAELYVDKLAAVAATTAADLEELSDGMSKVASAANTMGVDIDQLSAQLATIVSVTRQDANAVGTALKTIYARMGDLKVDGVDEFGTSLGDVSSQMKQMGVDVLDQQGNLRDMGEVIEEVAEKWGTWTDAQQQAAAVAIAGKRQYNNLIALFENWDMYESSLSTSKDAEGTLEEQHKTYQESIKAMLQELETAAEGVKGALFDSETIEDFTELLKGALSVIEHLTRSFGGLKNILPIALGFFTLLSKTFSGTISRGIYDFGVSIKNTFGTNSYFTELEKNYNKTREAAKGYNKELDELYKLQLKLEKAHQSGFFKDNEEEYNERSAAFQNARRAMEIEAAEKVRAEELMGVSFAKLQNEAKSTEFGGDMVLAGQASANIQANVSNVKTTASSMIEQAGSIQLGSKGLSSQLPNVAAAAKKKVDELKVSLEKLSKQPGINQDQIVKVQQYIKVLEDGTSSTKEKEAAVESLQEELVELATDYGKVANAAEGYVKSAATGEAETEAQKNVEEQRKQIQNKNKDVDVVGNIQSIAEVAGSVMAMIGAVNSLSDAIDGLKNGTLSISEGITGILGGLASGIFAVIPMIQLLGNAATASFGMVGLAIMTIMVLAMGVMKIVDAVLKKESALTKSQKKLDEMNKTLSEMKDSAREARQSYIDLKAELEDYRAARRGLDELRAGTEEWRNAIDELNLQVLDLIDKYEGLELTKEKIAGKTVYGVDSASIDKVLKAKQEESKQRDFAVQSQKLAVAQQELDVLYNKEKDSYNTGEASTGGKIAAISTLGVGLAASIPATIFGGPLGLLLAGLSVAGAVAINQADAARIANERTEKLNDLMGKSIDELKNLSEIEIESLGANKELIQKVIDIKEKIKEEKDKTAIAFAESKGVDANVFSNLYDENGKTVKIGDGRSSFIDYDGFNDLVKVQLDENGKIQLKGDGTIKEGAYLDVGGEIQAGDVKQVQEWLDNLAKAAYGKDAIVSNYGTLQGEKTSNLNSLKITLKDYGEMTIGELQQAVVTAAQRQQMENENKELIDYQKNAQQMGWAEETAYFSEHNKAALKDGSFNAAKAVEQWEEGTLDQYSSIAQQSGLTDQEAKNIKAARGEFEKQLIDSLANGLSQDLSQYSQLTLSQVHSLSTAINRAEMYGGGGAVTSLINSVTDPAKKAELATLLSSTDFGSATSVATLQSNLVDMGVDIDDSKWKSFFDNINSGMAQWVEDSKKVRENLSFIKNTLSQLEVGDTISDEDYQKLIAMNPSARKDFIQTVEGWVATRSGKNIAAETRARYGDLAGLKTEYENIRSYADTATKSGVRMGQGAAASTKQQLFTYFGYTQDGNNWVLTEAGKERRPALASLLGVSESDINNMIKASWAGDDDATSQLTQWAQEADQKITNAKTGQLDEEDAVAAYATSGVSVREAVTVLKAEGMLDKGWLTYLSDLLIDELQAVSEQYRDFITSEREFWDVELEAWKNLGTTPTVQDALGGPSVGAQNELIETKAAGINNFLVNTLRTLSVLDPKEQEEDFLNLYDTAKNDILSYKELAKETESLWISALDEIFELYDKEISRYKELNTVLTSSADLLKLVGYNVDGATDKIQNYYKTAVNSSQFSYQAALEKHAKAQEIYNEAMAENADITDEMREKAIQGYQEATQELTDAANEWIEIIKTSFTERVSAAIQDAVKNATGYGYSDMSQAWELEKARDERYLDDVNRAYAIDDFERKIQKSIDETDNLSVQKRLNDLRQRELALLEQKGKLTQYDLDRANAEYELELKRIALEEAQQTANKMQLTRDSMGNYTYQYVTDQNEIAEAEEQLAAASNELYNLDKDRKKELIDEWFTMMTEYEEKMSEAMATGNTELQEDIQNYYFGENGILKAIQDELNLMGLDNIFGDTADRISRIKIVGDDGKTSLSTIMSGILTDIQTSFSTVNESISSTFGDEGALTKAIDNLSGLVELNPENIENAFDNISNESGTGAADLLVNNMSELAGNLKEYVDKITQYITDLEPYSEKAKNIVTDNITELSKNTAALSEVNGTLEKIQSYLETDEVIYQSGGGAGASPSLDNRVRPTFDVTAGTL